MFSRVVESKTEWGLRNGVYNGELCHLSVLELPWCIYVSHWITNLSHFHLASLVACHWPESASLWRESQSSVTIGL